MSHTTSSRTYFVVPCGAAKLDGPAPACQLYTGTQFRFVLAAAQEEAIATERELGGEVRVLIMSAAHGLVELDTVLSPYDVKMGDAGSVSTQQLAETAEAAGIEYGCEVFTFLPSAYRVQLAQALDSLDVFPQSVYEGTGPQGGVGYQRGVAASLNRYNAA